MGSVNDGRASEIAPAKQDPGSPEHQHGRDDSTNEERQRFGDPAPLEADAEAQEQDGGVGQRKDQSQEQE